MDWFQIQLVEDWGETKAFYKRQTPEVKAQIDEIFGEGEDVFEISQNAENWVTLRIDDLEELEEKKRQL